MREPMSGRSLQNGGPGKVTWQPMQYPAIDPASVDATNIFYRRRSPIRAQVAGRTLTFEPQWQSRRPEIADPWTLTLKLDQATAELVLPQSAVLHLLRDLEASVALEALSADHRALIIEFALSDHLDALEAALGVPVAIVTAERGEGTRFAPGEQPLSFLLAGDGLARCWGLVRAGPVYLLRLAQGLDRLRSPVPSPSLNEMPMAVNLRWASVDLSLSELSTLVPGDIVLADVHCNEPETVIAVFGDHLAARAKITADGYQLLDTLKPVKGSGLDWSSVNPLVQPGGRRDGTAQDIPMRVFFELRAFQLPMAKLRDLRPGARIGTEQHQDPYFDIVVEGTRIGRGELTTIGMAAGVRIVRG